MSTLVLLVALTPAVGPPPARADAAALVQQLGSEKYAVRVEAERRLLALGTPAVPAVMLGRRHVDLEVRRRCQGILSKLRAVVCAARIEALRDGQHDSTIPLWDHFRRLFGDGREARALFADLYEKECEAFEEIALALSERDHDQATLYYRDQVERLVGRPTGRKVAVMPGPGPRAGKVADLNPRLKASLFLGTLPGMTLHDYGWAGMTHPLSYDLTLRQELAAKGPAGDVLRSLLGRWCRTAQSELALWNALWQVMMHGLGEPGRALARRALGHESLQVRAGAACALGHHGEKEDIPRLLPLLRVKENYHRTLVGVEVGDVALEALAQLTGQDSSLYGFVPDRPLFTTDRWMTTRGKPTLLLLPVYPVSPYRDPARREEAFRRWRRWAAKNPGKLGDPFVGPLPFDARQAYEHARDAALNQYVTGQRLKHLARHRGRLSRADFGRVDALLSVTIEGGRLKVGPPAGRPKPNHHETRVGHVPGLGATAVTHRPPDDRGRPRLKLVSAFADDAAGVLATTTIDRDSDMLVIEIEHRDRHETLHVRYAEPDDNDVLLTVRRVRHTDGAVLSKGKHIAKDLAALKKSAPESYALMMGLLAQRGAKSISR